jgi:cell division protein FtsL
MLSVIGLVLFFGVIYARVFLDKSAFDIADLQNQITTQQQFNQQLRMEVSDLQAPGRVFATAIDMGLIHPEQPPIVVGNQ